MKVYLVVAVILTSLTAYSECTALTWSYADDTAALCNDFTQAGFFNRRGRRSASGEEKWVVFLESGSLCYSNETCNRRYFQSHIRYRYSSDFRGENAFGDFDTESVWNQTQYQPRTEVVSPLMTSLHCFRNETQFFTDTDSDELSIEGRDVLSSDCDENPAFCDHGHVLVPYCSSDLWLGSEDTSFRQLPCNCWDQDCFKYNPKSEDLQFTFRGQTIFRSVLETLDRMYDLQRASEIVLVGSSAGGVGVLNSAKWVREKFENVSIKVITDSSWFINFRDAIVEEFRVVTETDPSQDGVAGNLLSLLSSNEACNDTRLGYPCCLSADCLLLEKSATTREPYYPQDVPVFALTSLYDIFLLANALSRLAPLADRGVSDASLGLQFITTVGEYGGAMDASLIKTSIDASRSGIRFTYYVTQCFQHIYLSSSTLRGENSLLGNENVEISTAIASFR